MSKFDTREDFRRKAADHSYTISRQREGRESRLQRQADNAEMARTMLKDEGDTVRQRIQLEGTKHTADQSLAGTRHTADKSFDASVYTANRKYAEQELYTGVWERLGRMDNEAKVLASALNFQLQNVDEYGRPKMDVDDALGRGRGYSKNFWGGGKIDWGGGGDDGDGGVGNPTGAEAGGSKVAPGPGKDGWWQGTGRMLDRMVTEPSRIPFKMLSGGQFETAGEMGQWLKRGWNPLDWPQQWKDGPLGGITGMQAGEQLEHWFRQMQEGARQRQAERAKQR
jgi:hypothetical protein